MRSPQVHRFVPLAAYALGALILAGILSFLPASPASAHAVVTTTTPAASEVVTDVPEAVHIQFNEKVTPIAAATGVVAPTGERADLADGDLSTDNGTALSIALREDLPDGTYLVSYRVVSDDGHPIAGTFTFSINDTSDIPDSDALSLDGDPTTQAFVYLNRYIGYLGLALALGTGVLLVGCNLRQRALAGKLIATGLAAVAATAMAGIYFQTAYTNGVSLGGVTGEALEAFLLSWVGVGHMLRLLVVLMALPLLRTFIVSETDQPVPMKLGLGAFALALSATWPMTGHAIASGHPVTAISADTLHLAAATAWLGGLIVLLVIVLRYAGPGDHNVVTSWSTWAGYLIATLFAAGVANSFVEIDSITSLFNTSYGQMILAKAAGLSLIVFVAFFSRRVVRKQSGQARTLLRRLIAIEVALALAVLMVVVVLVQTVPARVANYEADQAAVTELSTIVNTDEFTATITLDPGRVGNNSIRILINEADSGDLMPLEEWEASFGQSGDQMRTIRLVELRGGILGGEITLPEEGEWTFAFDITTVDGAQAEGEAVVTPYS
ncbi:copper resistance protein CopC [Natronoglycomyces albus]|uniref:Copper resistance protein CopC n=1 Tax=Natronoglycomyces albus TaxID=2811108 RepID=A0A895XQU5_9ACTN|nr:copper resistance protein CopC [Natronoglycomyces albus]QSB04926.1 copper resistance protein CopC [Natronoglycomyces albus]